MEKGTLYLGNIKDAIMYQVLDHKYLLDLDYKSKVNKDVYDIYGFKNLKGLKPSKDLIIKCTDLKTKGEWNIDIFNSWYIPLFKEEIKTQKELKNSLNYIYKILKSGHDVALLCSCYDYNVCTRKIIGEEFRRLGFDINVK